MARTVPLICAKFLDRIPQPFLSLCGKQKLGVSAGNLRKVGNAALVMDCRLAKDLRWTFRWKDEIGGQLEFNVECVPRRSLGIDRSVLVEAADEARLEARTRIDGARLVYSIAIGHESKAHELHEHGIVGDNLTDFAVKGMVAMLRLLDRYGERPAVRPARTAPKATVAVGGTAVTEQIRLALEASLEDLIIEQWNDLDFGAELVFVDRQVQCGDVGCLDILATDKATGGLVVIELKRDQGDDETFGQLSRYMGWVSDNMPQPDGVPVAGIIIAAESTPRLAAAASTNPNVRLVEYAIRIALSPKGRIKTGVGD